jgi:hypothetical protein
MFHFAVGYDYASKLLLNLGIMGNNRNKQLVICLCDPSPLGMYKVVD